MRLYTASLQGTHGALVEETKLLNYSIQHKFNEPAIAIVTLSDADGSLLAKYSAIPTVYCVAKDGAVYTTETTAGNDDTLSDMHLMPADQAGATVDDYFFGFDSQVAGMRLLITQAGVWLNPLFAITWKYSQGGGVWANLAGVSDGSDRFTIAGASSITWTVPGDWATDTVNAIAGKYWVRAYVSISSLTTTQPLGARVSSGIYLGPGRVTIEDPNATLVFDGRIAQLETNTERSRLSLICYDWLDQLNEQTIDYDMREDLNGSGLRESALHSDTNADYDTVRPVHTAGAVYTAYDDDMAWAADQWIGEFVILPNAVAGEVTVGTGPSSIGESGDLDTDIVHSTVYKTWTDGSDYVEAADNSAGFFYIYPEFKLKVTEGSLFTSLTGGRIKIVCSLQDANGDGRFQLLGTDDATHYTLGDIHNTAGSEEIRRYTFEVPYTLWASVLEADGTVEAVFYVPVTGGTTARLKIYYCWLEVDVITEGYASPIEISDSTTNTLVVDTDLDTSGLGLWEGCPYSICKEIYKHIHTGLGTLITAGDTLYALTCDGTVEHTTGISTRHYSDRTRLEIMQDLAKMDRASFWETLGGVVVNWKQTFNDGAPTALTDASVLQWGMNYDYHAMHNNCRVYGIRIADNQLVTDSADLTPDPGAVSKSIYGATRSEVVNNAGMISEADTVALAGIVAARDKSPPLFLNAKFGGLSTLRLGSEVSITSTRLGLTTAYYVVSKWTYDSNSYRTEVELSPRSSVGFTDRYEFADRFRQIVGRTKELDIDSYRAIPYSRTWS